MDTHYFDLLLQIQKLRKRVSKLERPGIKWCRSKFIWTLVCVAACCLQFYGITKLYLEYEFNAEYYNYPTEPIIVPTITVCIAQPFKTKCRDHTCSEFMSTSRTFIRNSVDPLDVFTYFRVVHARGEVHEYKTQGQKQLFLNDVSNRYILGHWLCYQFDLTKVKSKNSFAWSMVRNSITPVILTSASVISLRTVLRKIYRCS